MAFGIIDFVGVSILMSSELLLMSVAMVTDRETLHTECDCPLNGRSTNSWLVKIWDTDYGITMSHGSIVAKQVILSTCSHFIDAENRISQFLIIGQNDQKAKKPHTICTQSKNVHSLYRHPKCDRVEALKSEPRSTNFVNLAIWIIKGRFETKDVYPTLKIHPQLRFLDDLQELEASPDNPGCSLPTFLSNNKMNSDFPRDSRVSLIPYSKKCVALMCQETEDEEACRSSNRNVKNGSQMCVVLKWMQNLPIPAETEPNVDWFNGSPLVCNNTLYGISTHTVVVRSTVQDFFVITTFLDHIPWLNQMIRKFESPREKEETTRDPSKVPFDKDDYAGDPSAEQPDAKASRAPTILLSCLAFFISLFTINFILEIIR